MQDSRNTPPVVLVVEDEPLVRMVAVDLLEDAGFAVLEATTGDEGLSMLRTRPDVRVLFTDVDMPGSLDGSALARAAAVDYPHVAVLIVSGKAAPRPGDLPPGARFIPKPYSSRVVVEHIRAVATPA